MSHTPNFNSFTNSHLSCMFVTYSPCIFQPHVYTHVSRLCLACLCCTLQWNTTSFVTPTFITCLACLAHLSPCTHHAACELIVSYFCLECLRCPLQPAPTPTLTCLACLRHFLLARLNLMPTCIYHASALIFVLHIATASLALSVSTLLQTDYHIFVIFYLWTICPRITSCSFSFSFLIHPCLSCCSCTFNLYLSVVSFSFTFLCSYFSCSFALCFL